MRIAATVILYHPPPDLSENIKSYLPFVDRLYIMNNTEDGHSSSSFPRDSKISAVNDKQNKGIAKRLNEACAQAASESYDWLLTMDQDSSFDEETIKQYLSVIQNIEAKDSIAMIGLQYVKKDILPDVTVKPAKSLITSGSIVNIKVAQTIGGFDEKLFIDDVDIEYCYRARANGYKVLVAEGLILNHQLGTGVEVRSLKSGAKTSRSLHTPIRLYYMVRNFLYVQNKYPDMDKKERNERSSMILNRIKNNLLYGSNKLDSVKYILKGYSDFKKGKMGKIN